jgi:hypothetical protein
LWLVEAWAGSSQPVEAWAGGDLPVEQANRGGLWAAVSCGGLGQASGGGESPAQHRLPGSNAATLQGDGEGCARPAVPVESGGHEQRHGDF